VLQLVPERPQRRGEADALRPRRSQAPRRPAGQGPGVGHRGRRHLRGLAPHPQRHPEERLVLGPPASPTAAQGSLCGLVFAFQNKSPGPKTEEDLTACVSSGVPQGPGLGPPAAAERLEAAALHAGGEGRSQDAEDAGEGRPASVVGLQPMSCRRGGREAGLNSDTMF